MRLAHLIGAVLAAWTFFLPLEADAAPKEKPTINWTADVIAMDDDNQLVYAPGVREKIAQALTAKLHSLDMSGKLPFKLKSSAGDYKSLHNVSDDEPLGLIPLSTLDTSFDTVYHMDGKTYYRSVIFSGLTIAICNTDAESGAGAWRILGCIPINGYDVIGGSFNDLRETPVSRQEKADKFAEISIKLIRDYLDFNQDKKLLDDFEMKTLMNNTYQVTAVNISSAKAQQVFAGREQQIKDIIGAFFTGAYQKKTRRIFFPPRGIGRWKQDVSRNLYTFQAQTPSGEVVNFNTEAPKHPITLDLYGINSAELKGEKTSEVVRDIIYKAWIRKSPVEGKEKGEMSDHTTRRQIKTGNAWVEYDPADVFTELIIDTAENLGNQKI